jgi:hypothetical protein
MRPCPKCGCGFQRLAFRLTDVGTQVALACFSKSCDFTGPFTGMTFPPSRETTDRAADLWDAEIVRQSLPARLRARLPTADYVTRRAFN